MIGALAKLYDAAQRGEEDHVQATRGHELPAVQSPAVQVYVLGGFKVLVRGQIVAEHAWRRKTARQLFKILLSRPNRRMTRDEVIELLWPESDPDAASSNLRSTLFALRHALETPSTPAGLTIVFSDRDGVWLRPDVELWVDADAFEHTAEQAWRSSDPLPMLEQANNLYAGDYLPEDLYEDWATERREALKQRWAELQIRLAQELEQRGNPEAAVRHLHRLMQADPCDERTARELMRVLGRHQRRADALRVYQRLVQALAEELEVKPSEETVTLHRQIAAGDHDELGVGTAFRCAYPFPSPAELVGREAELNALERILASGRTGGQVALVGAPAGAGKSALVGQLVKRAQAQGVLCLAGGCYEERGAVPLGPFHDGLVDYLLAQPPDRLRADLGQSVGDLVQVIPELVYHLKMTEPALNTTPSSVDRGRAFGAIHACLRSLAERGPALVCLEDLHAADEATLQLFHYLARLTRRLPLVLVATYRSDEAETDQSLVRTLAAMLRERLAQQIDLRPLERGDTDHLLAGLLRGSASEPLGEALFATTGGNPFFVEQQVLALLETGQIQRRAGVWHGMPHPQRTPQIVRDVIGQRLRRLPASCREILAMASVLGKTFEYRVLLAAMEPLAEASLLEDLDRALAAHVLQETPSGYGFRHALLRDAMYWELSAPRRMLLHGRAGEVLERLHGQQADDYAGGLAHHFSLAGESASLRKRALHYSMHAGRQAAQLSSYPEALTHFSKAVELVERDTSLADPGLRVEALERRGEAEVDLALWDRSSLTFRQVLTLTDDPIRRARARGRIAFTYQHTGDISRVLEECNAALGELAGVDGPEAAAARLYPQQLIAIVWYLQGRYRKLVELGQEMQATAAGLGLVRPFVLAQAVLGWGYMGQGLVDQALAEYEPSLAACERGGEKVQLATTHENIGYQNYLGGRFADAREHLTRALTLYRESASELRAVNSLQHMCRVWVAEGELALAREQLQQAVELEVEGHERWAADGHHILGQIHTLRADWDSASASLGLALGMRRQVGDIGGIVESLVALGLVEQHRGHWHEALAAFDEATALANSMDPAPCRVLALRQRGHLRLRMGDHVTAATDIEPALALAETIPETLEYGPTLLAKAELCLHEGNLESAMSFGVQALIRTRLVDQIVETHIILSQVHLALGRLDEADSHASQGVALATRLDAPRLLCLTHLGAARVATRTPGRDAVKAFETALSFAGADQTPYERAAVLQDYADYLESTASHRSEAAVMAAEAYALRQRLGQSTTVSVAPLPG